jgi:hypothetical protein
MDIHDELGSMIGFGEAINIGERHTATLAFQNKTEKVVLERHSPTLYKLEYLVGRPGHLGVRWDKWTYYVDCAIGSATNNLESVAIPTLCGRYNYIGASSMAELGTNLDIFA